MSKYLKIVYWMIKSTLVHFVNSLKFEKNIKRDDLPKRLNFPRFISINGSVYPDSKNKFIKTSALLSSYYISGSQNDSMIKSLESSMRKLVTSFIITDYVKTDKGYTASFDDLNYRHLIYAFLPLATARKRSDHICLHEDNVISLTTNLINNNLELKQIYHDSVKFDEKNITPEKALSILAALSFGFKFNFDDWKRLYDKLINVHYYDLIALSSCNKDNHAEFNAAYMLYKNTMDTRWLDLMIKLFKLNPSYYPHYVLKSEGITVSKSSYKRAVNGFYNKKQDNFNQGVVRVLYQSNN